MLSINPLKKIVSHMHQLKALHVLHLCKRHEIVHSPEVVSNIANFTLDYLKRIGRCPKLGVLAVGSINRSSSTPSIYVPQTQSNGELQSTPSCALTRLPDWLGDSVRRIHSQMRVVSREEAIHIEPDCDILAFDPHELACQESLGRPAFRYISPWDI